MSARFVSLIKSMPVEDIVGIVPTFLHYEDDRSIRAQIEDRYSHGGGWRPIEGFRVHEEPDRLPKIYYPASEEGKKHGEEDEWYDPLAFGMFRNVDIYAFSSGLFLFRFKPEDGGDVVVRMD